MPGQDTILLLLPDSVKSLQETFESAVFEVSSLAVDQPGAGNGMALLEKAEIYYPTWFFIYLFTLLGFFAWVRLYYGSIFSQTVQATADFQVATRMYKDNSLLQNQLDSSLYFLYFLTIAFFLNFIELRMEIVPYGLKGGGLFLFNVGLLVGIFMGRLLMINVAGILFGRVGVFREYLYNVFIFNKLMGMATLPMLLLMVYTRGYLQVVIVWMTIAMIGLIVIMRLIRGGIFSFKKDVSFFYLFLYLCALEIVPLVLLYRWLEGIL